MEGFLWLIFSWVVVALISYFIIGTFWGRSSDGVSSTNAVSVASSSRRATLADWSSEWFNEVVLWLWTSKRFSPSFIQLVVKALNDAAKKHAKLNQCEVHFTANKSSQVFDQRNVPLFEKIKAQQGSANTDHLILSTKVSAERFGVKVVASKQLPDGNVVVVESRLVHIADELFVMSCFVGKPEMCVDIQENNAQAYSNPQAPAIDSGILEELVRKCVVSAVLNFSLSEFLYSTSDSARNSRARLSSEFHNLNFLNEHYPPPPSIHQFNQYSEDANLPPNVLQIRVLGAQNLGLNQDVHQPFVCIEMDNPSQKFETTRAVSKHVNDCDPQWEETFEFNLAPSSDELLFEVYDEQRLGRANSKRQNGESQATISNRFLGLAIVGLSELKMRSNLPVHQLPLQNKPYGSEEMAGNVTGALLVEARFLHIPSIPTLCLVSLTT
uniref:C2 domain-containing protein n=1 Tax=Ditylenchus dipsaci TaxID=166011 RepID=A0A915EES8_9BILA